MTNLMSITEIIEKTLALTRSGKAADISVKVILINYLKDDEPFHPIELRKLEHLLQMMLEADIPFVFVRNSVFYFGAYYSHSDDYPIGRSYFIKAYDLFEFTKLSKFFQGNGLSLSVIPPHKLGELISEEGFQQRIMDYKAKKETEWAAFKALHDGRKEVNIVEKSVFLNTLGCLICGALDDLMMMSTLDNVGMMLGFKLCSVHFLEAKEASSLLDYLEKKYFPQSSFIYAESLDAASHVDMVVSYLPKELSTTILKVAGNTITLVRESNFKIILRLDSPTDYGYMIINPKGEEVSRFDSAKNHHNIPCGPDHLHPNLPRDKSVQSSFTTGTPMIDLPAILLVLQGKENQYKNECS